MWVSVYYQPATDMQLEELYSAIARLEPLANGQTYKARGIRYVWYWCT